MTSKIVLDEPPGPTQIGPLTLTHFVTYQGASGDLADIHHDQQVARAAGYDKPFAPGMYSAGLLASWATGWLGADNIRRFRVRFANMVFPGDVLSSSGVVTSSHDHGETTTIDLELTCSSGGKLVLRGWATFEIPTALLA